MTKTLTILVGSIRTNRLGPDAAQWIGEQAETAGFDAVDILDLKEVALPKFDAPMPPMYAAIDTPEAKSWAQKINDVTYLLVLTPEYNQSIPASLKSAIDHLSTEWNGKPTAIVSYGYMSGGANASKHLHEILGFLKTDLVDTTATIHLGDNTVVDGVFAGTGVPQEEVAATRATLVALSQK